MKKKTIKFIFNTLLGGIISIAVYWILDAILDPEKSHDILKYFIQGLFIYPGITFFDWMFRKYVKEDEKNN